MDEHVFMSGQLFPRDKIPGCLFTARLLADGRVYVELRSPHKGNGLVDKDTVPLERLGEWLEDRTDW